MILIRNSFPVERIALSWSWSGIMEAACIKIKTTLCPIYMISICCPPAVKVTLNH